MPAAYHKQRDPDEYDKAIADTEFMARLRSYDPDWETEYFQRNLVAMYHTFLWGKEAIHKSATLQETFCKKEDL